MRFSIDNNNAPVAIGGVGGSGTRLIADCLHKVGYDIGAYLNESTDNLWFTLLFKHFDIITINDNDFDELLDLFVQAMFGVNEFTPTQIELLNSLAQTNRRLHPSDWLQSIVKSLMQQRPKLNNNARWGWKEPNTHMVLDKLILRMPKMKYIHVMRNGFDMAHSTNPNQLIQWGKYFIDKPFEFTPNYSLKYWCIVHKRIIEIGKALGDNFMLLNYDEFCTNPSKGVTQFCDFLEIEDSQNLCELIKFPDSIGRYEQFGIEMFDKEDVAYVKSLGF